MSKIVEAKKKLRDTYRNEDGFVGVGIGQRDGEDTLRVYVISERFPLAKQLNAVGEFEGYPLEIEPTGVVKAFQVQGG